MKLKILSLSILFMVLGNVMSFAQNSTTIKGVVSSSSDDFPLVGANIVEKGTSNGVISDFDGNYTLTVSQGSIIVVSYQGFKTKELAIGTETIINISLDEDVSKLDEIVLIGVWELFKKRFNRVYIFH